MVLKLVVVVDSIAVAVVDCIGVLVVAIVEDVAVVSEV
jgi:hypothetical protein